MCIQTLVSFCQFVLKILSKNQILTSIKGRNSVANLRKTMIYNTKVDLVDGNVFTKFGLNLSIRFQDTPQPLYNTVRYNTVLDITRISVGPQMVIFDLFSFITIHFALVITRFG